MHRDIPQSRFRVVKPITLDGPRAGQVRSLEPGQLVDVDSADVQRRLLRDGSICPAELAARMSGAADGSVPAPVATTGLLTSPPLRVGIWQKTTAYYSGGRVHLYQMGRALAMNGAEVFLITNAVPKWWGDYAPLARYHLVIERGGAVPPDIDVVLTDGKSDVARRGMAWHKARPWTRLVGVNFETPNWVVQFDKGYARALPDLKAIFEMCDSLIANSSESRTHLLKFLDRTRPASVSVVYPALNDAALDAKSGPAPATLRPYCVWAARTARFKGGSVFLDAVYSYPKLMDAVMVGNGRQDRRAHALHHIRRYAHVDDAAKYALFKGARATLAPSLFEGFGMVPMESLACGTPCVVYDLPVLREVYGDDLVYAKWNDPKDFARKAHEVMGGAHRVSQKTAKKYRTRFSLHAMADRIEQVRPLSVMTPRISVQLCCYWGFVPEALESVYQLVNDVHVAFGPVAEVRKRGLVDDGSLERLRAFPDPDGKLDIEVRDDWRDKLQMREWCATRAEGNRMLLLDGDEIWTGLDQWIAAGVRFGSPRWVNLWHGGGHWVYDWPGRGERRWGEKIEPHGSNCFHYRWSLWRPSFRYVAHHTVHDAAGKSINPGSRNVRAAMTCTDCTIYHLGHALPAEAMRAKHEFYRDRDGDDAVRRRRQQAWQDWAGETGRTEDGVVDRVNWQLPDIVCRALRRLEGDCGRSETAAEAAAQLA